MTALPLFPVLVPVTLVVVAALMVLIFEPFLRGEAKHGLLPWLSALALAAVGVAQAFAPVGHFQGLYAMDASRVWLCEAILAAALCSVAGLQASLGRDRFPGGEPYALLLLSSAGAMLMVMAVDLMGLFLALELTSLPIYALVGLRRHRPEANEALFKYFIMGSVFSAVFLYGSALTYGATGGLGLGRAVLAGRETTFWLGQVLLLTGLLFKVGAVPFHFWVPDAYTGSPVAVTGFMAAVVKVGGFAALGSWWLHTLAAQSGTLPPGAVLDLSQAVTLIQKARDLPQVGAVQTALLVAAILSLFLGSLGALRQTAARRILAYSAIAHAGYMLLAFALPVGESLVLGSLWFYLAAYAISVSGVLAALAMVSGRDDQGDGLESLAGQGRARPFLGVVLTIFLASLAGIPVTMGFLGKFLVLMELVAKGHVAVAIFAMLMAVVGAVFYLRLLLTLWAVPGREPVANGPELLGRWALGAGAAAVVVLVAWPGLAGIHWLAP